MTTSTYRFTIAVNGSQQNRRSHRPSRPRLKLILATTTHQPQHTMTTVADQVHQALGRPITQAWNNYLTACRTAPTTTYDEVEAWAWTRLQLQLKRLKRRST